MIYYNPGTKKVWLEVGDNLIEMTGAISIETCVEKEKQGRATAVHQHDTRMEQEVTYASNKRKLAAKLANQ